jgi:hypothetical protein
MDERDVTPIGKCGRWTLAKRLLEAMREARPQTVRQFFALANQHMRWELDDLARRLDE